MARTLLDLLDELSPENERAFLRAIRDIRSDFEVEAFLRAYRRGDIEEAIAALNIDAGYFTPLDMALRSAYVAGGNFTFEQIKQAAAQQANTIVGAFGGGNERAQEFLRTSSSRLITEITEDMRSSVRTVLSENIRNGVAAERAALDIVGRANPQNGVRTGGILGLTEHQGQYVQNARAILTDPLRIREYFIEDRESGRFKPRYTGTDRRYDARVKAAIENGTALSARDADTILNRYAGRLLRERGRSIARTELLGSIHEAQHEGVQQMIDAGRFRADQVSVSWDATNDGVTRPTHIAAENSGSIRFGQTFIVGGFEMRFPGDRKFGAPAKEIIRCRCRYVIDIDFVAGLSF